jgi:hypothetical protein
MLTEASAVAPDAKGTLISNLTFLQGVYSMLLVASGATALGSVIGFVVSFIKLTRC